LSPSWCCLLLCPTLVMQLTAEVSRSTEQISTSRFLVAVIGQWEQVTSPLSGSSIKQVFRLRGHAYFRLAAIRAHRSVSASKVELFMYGLQAAGDCLRPRAQFLINGCILRSHVRGPRYVSSKTVFNWRLEPIPRTSLIRQLRCMSDLKELRELTSVGSSRTFTL
jgi:hypothetical protein